MHNVKSLLDEMALDLPIIRPIKEFIHLNLLLRYQNYPFWEALSMVSEKLEASPFPEPAYFQEKISQGDIPLKELREKLESAFPLDYEKYLNLITSGKFQFTHRDTRTGRLHEAWNKRAGVNIIQLADGLLIKWLSLYLDQGISLWKMPGAGELSFYEAVRNLLRQTLIKPSPFSRKNTYRYFLGTPEETIEAHLNFLCPDKGLQQEYLRECIFTLRGWAGLVHGLEHNPELLPHQRKIGLVDFLAMKLILERAWIEKETRDHSPPDFAATQEINKTKMEPAVFKAFQLTQEVFEEETYRRIFHELRKERKNPAAVIKYQAVFCMDDRECSLRRYLESFNPFIQTFGTAGHFGLECLYQHSHDAYPRKHCPAPVPAKFFLLDQSRENRPAKTTLAKDLIRPQHNIIFDWINSFTHAWHGFFTLFRNLFFPLAFQSTKRVSEVKSPGNLRLHREDQETIGGLPMGLTTQEMAAILYGQLKLMGFIKNFSPFIFIIGHGSKSTNNPYFATYDCGACSGRPGAPNARAFAQIGNDPQVRQLLEEKYDLKIPSNTRFIAGHHDTCTDQIQLFDTEEHSHNIDFLSFKNILGEALRKNAQERARSFKLVSYEAHDDAEKEVIRRAHSLFETRPELGHTGVVFAIVGRRELTLGKNLKRRSFLQSYDPTVDPDGKVLAGLLGAVIPVTSGISLDYYFSRVDNQRFGAGSKLPQNIVGNIGLSHGTESDLLVGLPYQMIDQHLPLRLFVLVEQKPEIAMKAIEVSPLVRDIVFNSWVNYGCYDQTDDSYWRFNAGRMVRIEL